MRMMAAALTIVLALGSGRQAFSAEPGPTVTPPQPVVGWIAAHVAAIGPLDQPPAAAEAAMIDRITAGARVIAFGESGHGNREPLEYRNRLVRYLVMHRGLTAVALESGLAESRRLNDYVLGGPDDGKALVRHSLTHGFGFLEANLALAEWLRAWNREHSARPVRLYGIDRSTIQTFPPATSSVVLADVATYLEKTVPERSATLRATLARHAARFNENDYKSIDPTDRRVLVAALTEAEALLRDHRAGMVRATSADAHDWAAREAYDAARLPDIFEAWTNDASDLPKLKRLIDLRDTAMADHVLWVLRREGARGRVLLFQANGHVSAAPMVGSVMRDFAEQPMLTGIALRRALGDRYRVIVTASSRGKPAGDPASGSIDRAFALIGKSPILLDLRAGRRPDWFSRTQTASQGLGRLDDVVPAQAFDGIVYFDRLTALPPPGQ